MKIFAVFGATGQQGSSVVNYIKSDAFLSRQYRIRAITRDATSERARNLGPGVEVVQADTSDGASVEAALKDVSVAYIMTTPSFGPNAVEDEFLTVKLIADACVQQGVESIIFSTLPGVAQLSHGKYTAVTAFDAKAKAEEYIRKLPVRSAFFAPASFMENLGDGGWLTAKEQTDGTWALCLPMSAQSRVPWIAARNDIGKFVGAMLSDFTAYEERRAVCGAVSTYSWEEIVAKLSQHTGRQVVYKQVSVEEFRQAQPFAPDLFTDAILFYAEPGYFGPQTEEYVAIDSQVPSAPLTSLDEWLASNRDVLG